MASEESSVVDDLKGSLTDGVKARLSDPILSTFVISFLVYNWDLWLMAFSGDSAFPDRIKAMKRAFSAIQYSTDWWIWRPEWQTFDFANLLRFLVPAVVTAFYIYLWPKWMKFPLEEAERMSILRHNQRERALLERVDVKQIIAGIRAEADGHKKENNDLLKQIGALESDKLKRSEALKNGESKIEEQKLEIDRLNDLLLTARKIASKASEPEEIVFDLKVRDYANRRKISLVDAAGIYSNALSESVQVLAEKYPQSESIMQMNRNLKYVLDGDSSSTIHFENGLNRFKKSGNAEEEDELILMRIDSILRALKNYHS